MSDTSGNENLSSLAPAAGLPSAPTRTATPTSSPEIQPGVSTPNRSLERYQILSEHGRGGIGRVSRAHDRELGRDVAIKELISRGKHAEARFLREAHVTARLEHPGIVPVHEAGRWPDGTPFYAMKLVSGRSLRDLISERTTVDQRILLLHHVIAVADAIAYAHGRNIIHRDLKPANVIVGDFGETIVIDWGLAKDLSAPDEPSIDDGVLLHTPDGDLTATGAVLGTPTYMAPEQARGERVDQRADVFAIGAMLWELCSLHKVPPTDPVQCHRLLRRAGIDRDLIVILDKALDPKPSHRYPNAEVLAADLKAFKSGAHISARSYSLAATLGHWTRRHRGLALSASLLVMIAAVVALLYVRNIAVERDRADSALADADTRLVTAGHDGFVHLLDSTYHIIRSWDLKQPVRHLSATRDSIVVALIDGTIWRISSTSDLRQSLSLGVTFSAFAVSPTGARIAAGTDDGELFLIDAQQRISIHRFQQGVITCLAYEDNLTLLACTPGNHVVRLSLNSNSANNNVTGNNQ